MVDWAQNTNLISKYVMSARMQFAQVSKSTFSSNILLLEVSFPLDLMPFSNLKSLTAKYIHQVWQKEWDEAIIVSNKLHLEITSYHRNYVQIFTDGSKVYEKGAAAAVASVAQYSPFLC